MLMSSSAAEVDGRIGSEPTAATASAAARAPIELSPVDGEALDALAAALTTDHGAVDVCRRAAGFLLAYVPGSVAVQITMHGATANAPPQVFTFPRRPPNAESAKDESDRENERSDDGGDTSAEDERASSSTTTNSSSSSSGGGETSLAAVSGSHAGSDRAVTWSTAWDDAAAPGPSPSSSPPAPPYSDWRSLAASHGASAFLTVPASVSGRPRASLTVAGTVSAAATSPSPSSPSSFPLPPSPAAAAAAATASAVAALLAPYLALAAVRRQLDVAQALLAGVMPHSVMAGVVERRALGLAPAMFGGGGGGRNNGGGGGNGGGGNVLLSGTGRGNDSNNNTTSDSDAF